MPRVGSPPEKPSVGAGCIAVVVATACLPLIIRLDRWIIFVVLFGAVALYHLVARVLRNNQIASAPLMVGAVPTLSYVRVVGVAEAIPGDAPLRDPIEDVPCLWFAVETWRRDEFSRRPGHAALVKRAESSRDFFVRDGLGVCKIRPAGAQVDVAESAREEAGGGLVHRIWRIYEGDRLTVAGAAVSVPSKLDGADRQIIAPADGKQFHIVCRGQRPMSARATSAGDGLVR